MKNLNFLSNLCGLGRASQSSDVVHDCRSTVVRPSFDCRSTMLKLVSVLAILLTIGSGNVWGTPTVLFHETFGNNTGSARAWDDSYSVKSGVSAVYSGITGYTVSNCKQGKNTTGSTQSGLNQTTQGTDAYIIIGPLSVASYSSLGVTYQWKAGSIKGTYTTKLYYATSSGGSYTEVSGTGTGATSFVERSYSLPVAAQVSTLYLKIVWNTSNTQAIIDEVELTGTAAASCDKKVTIVKGTPETGGSFNLDKTGAQDCCSALTVTVSNITAPSGKEFDAITQSGIATGVTINQSAKTVTYAANSTGTSTINVTFRDLPKYTVTLMDDGDTRTQASYEASVTLPSRAGCTGYTFAGWTKTWVAPQSSWTTTAPTIIPAGSYTPSANENLYPVYTKTEGGGTTETTVTETFTNQTSHSSETNWKQALTWGASESNASIEWTTYYGKIANGYTEIRTYSDNVMGYLWTSEPITGLKKVKFKGWRVTESDAANMVVSYSTDKDTWYELGTHAATSDNSTFSDEFEITSSDPSTAYYFSIDLSDATCPSSSNKKYRIDDIVITTETGGGSTTYYISVPACCTDPGLAYGTGSVTKTFGEGTFTNTLTNSNGVSVSYVSSVPEVATVASDGTVTIVGAGTTTITASCVQQTISSTTYCADEASYTLTVNKANISPTLSYTPNSVAVGENTSAPTVGGNPGSGGVTYAITSATPSGCATINTSTGVVTGVAVGSVTVTATIAATDNYNGNTATATVSIIAASYFQNGATVFIQADSKDYSAWKDDACVKAWFNASGAGGAAQTTYWLFDATDTDAGKKLFATVVPASGSLNQVTVQRFAEGCGSFLNANGTLTQASSGGVNTFRSYGSADNNIAWNGSSTTLSLYGSQNSWASSLATFTDQGSGVWTASFNNYAPDATSKDYKIKTSYNNGWIGNTGSNNNATLSGMIVGSTYNVTATLDVTAHSLEMSKTFVKGTVHFNLQGHGLAISDLTNVTAGSKISAPSAPSATGWDFGGWYKEPACTNAWNFASDVVNETMTLYAKWTVDTYTITKTLTNVTSSPVIPSTYTYTGAAASLSYTITPSSGYRLPTEITVSGTTYTWNPATGALVLTGIITNNVTITISAVQTHTVDWYVGGSAVGNKLGDDGQTTVVDHGGKISDFPATTPDGSACDKTFVGWTNTSSYVHGTSPLFNDVAGSPTINADAQFYAVFAEGGSTEDEITVAETGATAESGTYYSWSDVSISSDAVYAGNTAGGSSSNASVQMRSNNSNSGIVTKASGGKVTKVVVDWNSSSVNGRTLDIYGKNTAYTAATDLYDNSTQGTKLGSIVNGTSTELEISGDYSYIGLRSNSGAMYLNSITITWSSATGHTINCTSCANSVTVSYSAPGSGNMMTVTKGSTPIASGTSVKTCSAQSLTVTLTPTTHYTVTGFTATGVTGVTTSNVGNVYTVNIPADKTGTLNLTPTFTPETPLTITLSTNSKGTLTNPDPWPIYSGESFTFPDVTPNDPSCATFVGWIEGTTFVGDGTTHDAPVTIAAGSSSGAQSSNTTYTAVFYETETSESDAYVKVTSTPANWANDHYLIVYEDAGNSYTNAVAFAGSRDNGDNGNIDATSNGIAVTIVGGNTIAATSSLAANEWRIAAVTGGYSIQSASGYYIGRAANSNGIDASNSTAYVNTIGYSDSRTNITSAGGKILKYNTAGDQLRFRYLTSGGDIQLYKLGTAVVATRTYTTNPSCTPKYRVTVASVTGGSPSADPKFNPESTTVTITANPSAGYSFTSWTITKTTGADNVTSTLLTGDKPTTANTTFTMPAYDITIAATYTKKMVSTLEVKDGATVISTTTGPVSGTVNISTGANKTLDVVITPSDAYDHSWTATVSAGSTYASITNVMDDGFRVNGLAQGDATITVNAPNDGSAKSVTLTVQVRDIMPEEIILKRDGSNTPIETLIMYYDETNSKGQYVKVNVGYSPANPTNKAFTFSSALTGKVGSHSHAPASGYEVLVANGVTSDAVNCTFTSSADGSVTKVLAVTVLPILSDRFVDYVHGNATQTVSARLSDDRYSIIPDINTPSLSDASDANPTSEDCETSHYHLVGWLPQTTAEALWAAGTPITDATEGLVRAGESVEATGQTWCAIWAEEAE